jgi:spoIIIJ-associated protein
MKMDEHIEEFGKNIEDATRKALERINATREQVIIEILNGEEEQNILGGVRIKVTPLDLRKDSAEKFIDKILDNFNIKAEKIWGEKDNNPIIKLYGKDMGIIIGNKGRTLEAIQLLMSIIANKNSLIKGKIFLDIEDYKERKLRMLKQLAMRMAEKAIETGEEVILKPMIASERKTIHRTLSENDEVITTSIGEEPYRKVIITPVSKYNKL